MKRGLLFRLKIIIFKLLFWFFTFLIAIISWLDSKIHFPLPFPRNLKELSQKREWLLKILKESGALPDNVEVYKYTITENTAIKFRSDSAIVEINYRLNGELNTFKCFAKFAPSKGSLWSKIVFILQLNHIKEAFFNKTFINNDEGVASPCNYYTNFSTLTGNICLIMEYIENFKQYDVKADNLSFSDLELALENLASLHAHFWKSTEERMKFIMLISDSTVYTFDSLVTHVWSNDTRNVFIQSWIRMNKFQTVIHGDARIGNMMFPIDKEHGRFVFIDWQAVRKGNPMFDLAYFLITTITIEHDEEREKQAKQRYYHYLTAKGVNDYTWSELEEDYKHACLCALGLICTPYLNLAASVEGEVKKIYSANIDIWMERLSIKFSSFDYQWMADRYQLTEQQSSNVINEMLEFAKKLNK